MAPPIYKFHDCPSRKPGMGVWLEDNHVILQFQSVSLCSVICHSGQPTTVQSFQLLDTLLWRRTPQLIWNCLEENQVCHWIFLTCLFLFIHFILIPFSELETCLWKAPSCECPWEIVSSNQLQNWRQPPGSFSLSPLITTHNPFIAMRVCKGQQNHKCKDPCCLLS